jgi:hypothetical protein
MPPGIPVPTFEADAAARFIDNTISVRAALTTLHIGRAAGASELPAEYLRYAVDYVCLPSSSGPPANHSVHLLDLVPMLLTASSLPLVYRTAER